MAISKVTNRGHNTLKSGFTLIEIMVALAILMLMLLIVFVPVNLGINLFNLGKTNSEVQSAATLTIQQMEADLQSAIYVYPNALVPGVTDQAPYNGNPPYIQSTSSTTTLEAALGTTPAQVCSSGHQPASNPTRLDMIIGQVNATTNQMTPTSVVTYYARRIDPISDYKTTDPQNLMVLYRAQIPIPTTGVDMSSNRYLSAECSSSSTLAGWLTQNYNGEPDLSGIAPYHNRAIGINMAVVASNAGLGVTTATPAPAAGNTDYQPNTTFTCIDTVGDGKIHRVVIDLTMGEYDAVGAGTYNTTLNLQTIHVKQVVDLPNVR